MRYRLELQILKMSEKIPFEFGLRKAKLLPWMIFESLSLAIHAPPGLNFHFSIAQQNYYIEYSFDVIVAVFTCTRTYLAYKFLAVYSTWNSAAVNKVW